MFSFFPAKYLGLSVEEVMYDPEKLWKAQWNIMTEFQQDMEQNPFALRFLGPILETLDYQTVALAGTRTFGRSYLSVCGRRIHDRR